MPAAGDRSIGILAPAGTPFAERLMQALVTAGCRPVSLALGPVAVPRLTIDGVHLSWDGPDLTGLAALVVHGLHYEEPILPPAAPVVDWALWQSRHIVAQQHRSALFSLLMRLEDGGLPLFNGASGLMAAFCRDHLLRALKLDGVPVVPLLCTNDPAAAQRLRAQHGDLVWRPTTGRAGWQRFGPRQEAHLLDGGRPPVLLAPIVPGPLRSILVFDGVPLVALEAEAPAWADRERFERFRCVSVDAVLSDSVQARLTQAAARLGIRWFSAAFVAGADGPVLYDLEAAPAIDDLPERLVAAVAERLAAALAGVAHPAPLDGDAIYERETLFLTRMLQIQFEMEATKHRADAVVPVDEG